MRERNRFVEEPQYAPHVAPSALWPMGWGVRRPQDEDEERRRRREREQDEIRRR